MTMTIGKLNLENDLMNDTENYDVISMFKSTQCNIDDSKVGGSNTMQQVCR